MRPGQWRSFVVCVRSPCSLLGRRSGCGGQGEAAAPAPAPAAVDLGELAPEDLAKKLKGLNIEKSRLDKIIYCLNIRDHEGKVYFPEVMWAIFYSICARHFAECLIY